eukprot:GEMP01010034.1.p1 GENE.GEMP01010034.1~~GEMP01010034.1.p1  ORF type:complete len:523 (+),score=117.90 GEMP01010034.1:124-1692(+)
MWQQQQGGQQLPGTQQLLHFHPVTMNFNAVDVNSSGVNLGGRVVAGPAPQQAQRTASNPHGVARGQRRHQQPGMPGEEQRRHHNIAEDERYGANGTSGTPRNRHSGESALLGPQRVDSSLLRSFDDGGSTGAPESNAEDKKAVRRCSHAKLGPESNADDKNSIRRSSNAKLGVGKKDEAILDDDDDGKGEIAQEPIPERTDAEIIESATTMFEEFSVARRNEEIDMNNMETTRSIAISRRTFVNDRLTQMKHRYFDGKTEHEKTSAQLAIYHGDGEALQPLAPEEIEEVCDTLNRAKETATVAQALYSSTSHTEKESHKEAPMLSEKEKKSFEVLQLPTKASVGARTDEIISKVILELQELRIRESQNIKTLHEGYSHIAQIQAEHEQLIHAYQNQVEGVRDIERKHSNAASELCLLSGQGDLNSLTIDELKTLSGSIGKYLRKVHLALAVQQLHGKGECDMKATKVIAQTENGLCIVCYEFKWNTSLSPCGHVLCENCASRLKFCPTCRAGITARQRMYVQ